jgi:hypothetical protein
MNTRCYKCGWSFSFSREALEEAAVTSTGQRAHVIHCPRCRQAIRIPMDQITRALPDGWEPPAATAVPTNEEAAASAQTVAEAAKPAEPTQRRAERRHRHSGKTNSGNSAAVPAAKKNTHPT